MLQYKENKKVKLLNEPVLVTVTTVNGELRCVDEVYYDFDHLTEFVEQTLKQSNEPYGSEDIHTISLIVRHDVRW
jgi:hypothetical protein